MTDKEMRIAVAEACPGVFGICKESGDIVRWMDEEGIHCEDCDPLNDLNAMHEAGQKLTNDEWRIFLGFLGGRRTIPKLMSMDEFRQCFEATARQRCEAFLRTVGKWKD